MSCSQKGREGQVSEVWEHNEGTKGILKGWGHRCKELEREPRTLGGWDAL